MPTPKKTVTLVKVTPENLIPLVQLTVTDPQKNFVASNTFSLAEAYANVSNGRFAQPFGIYADGDPVGFLMIGYDVPDEEEDRIKYPFVNDSYLIWRLMIDKYHQGKGYGKEAMRLALEYIRTFPCGKSDLCWLSYEPENEIAKNLYASFGFVEQPLPDGWDEVPAVLKL
ncbi:MAG: GNAT family N-acetyltransferase [Clostridia bacterium]|nr:GNAT family N-acetyltransferase [Clostridia bacterium]